MSLAVRDMKFDDVPRIFELEQKIFPDPWPEKSFYLEINNTKISRPCVLLKDSIICGYAVVWEFANELHIGNVAIENEQQGRGLGSFLLSYILEKHKRNHATYLEVRKSNITAIGLYKKFGFVETYRRNKYYADGEDALVMEKILDYKFNGD